MSGSDEQDSQPSAGTMADHLRRYRNYIGDLKRGQSSGISAAFGRASDLLPPEVLEIKAPAGASAPVGTPVGTQMGIEARSPQATEAAASAGAPVEAPGGAPAATSEGASAGKTVAAPGAAATAAQPQKAIREQANTATSPAPQSHENPTQFTANPAKEPTGAEASPPQVGQNVFAAEFDRKELRDTIETLIKNYADGLEDPVGRLVRTEGGQEEVLAVYIENDERMYMLSDLSVIDELTFKRNLIVPENLEKNSVDIPLQPSISTADQMVTTTEGSMLWQIYYDNVGPSLVSMADGGVIKRAEGREEYVFSRLSAQDGDIKFYILSGFVVDPATGNIYLEANQGAYTLALLNNGWQIHQYRNHQGVETFFVSEPMKPGAAQTTYQVRSLELDLATGSVSYETMDSSATIALKSRKLQAL